MLKLSNKLPITLVRKSQEGSKNSMCQRKLQIKHSEVYGVQKKQIEEIWGESYILE